jgi:hypothetical protein
MLIRFGCVATRAALIVLTRSLHRCGSSYAAACEAPKLYFAGNSNQDEHEDIDQGCLGYNLPEEGQTYIQGEVGFDDNSAVPLNTAIPEAGTLLQLRLGLLGFGFCAARKRRHR